MAIKILAKKIDRADFTAVKKGRTVRLDADAVALVEDMKATVDTGVGAVLDPECGKGKARSSILAAVKAKAPGMKLRQRMGEYENVPALFVWLETA